MTPAAGQQPAGFVPRGETRPGGAVGRRAGVRVSFGRGARRRER